MTEGFSLVFAVACFTLVILLVGTFLEWISSSREYFISKKRNNHDGVGQA